MRIFLFYLLDLISSLVFPRMKYSGKTLLGLSVAVHVNLALIKELEIWRCYKVVSEPRFTDLKARLKDFKKVEQ